jgi:endonuclease/exonuclease/phosphatase family metal-dependent hydrolase
MHRLSSFILLSFITASLGAQSLSDLSFGTDETLEIVSWNIEWFPKDGQTTIDSVAMIIQALDADVLALQEISDTTAFRAMIDGLPGFETYFESSWFAGLAYVYKSATVTINDFYEIYTTEPYWSAFPRSPLVMEMTFDGEDYVIFNNHFKCCGDGTLDIGDVDDEETRRYAASVLLKDHIDTNFPNENVFVVGDLNDILTDSESNNVFQLFIDDAANYTFADFEIASGSSTNWSYPGWPSHLDHILVTNELFPELEDASSVVQTIKIENFLAGGLSAYDDMISDHRPVGFRFEPQVIGTSVARKVATGFTVFPNPAADVVYIKSEDPSFSRLVILTLTGELVLSQALHPGMNEIHLELLTSGLYILRSADEQGNQLSAVKLMVRH